MPARRGRRLLLVATLLACSPRIAVGQLHDAPETAQQTPLRPMLTPATYVPITGRQRLVWAVDGTVGPRSLLIVGPLAAGWNTGFNMPEEWGHGWSGFGKRYAQREADVAISTTIEAGLGAWWDEEPRYISSGRKGIWRRARYALLTSVVAQRRDGRRPRPAWGRYAGNTLNNVIENTWLPPSQTTAAQTALRSGMGIVTRMGGNLWEEFWPDVLRLMRKQ